MVLPVDTEERKYIWVHALSTLWYTPCPRKILKEIFVVKEDKLGFSVVRPKRRTSLNYSQKGDSRWSLSKGKRQCSDKLCY